MGGFPDKKFDRVHSFLLLREQLEDLYASVQSCQVYDRGERQLCRCDSFAFWTSFLAASGCNFT